MVEWWWLLVTFGIGCLSSLGIQAIAIVTLAIINMRKQNKKPTPGHSGLTVVSDEQ